MQYRPEKYISVCISSIYILISLQCIGALHCERQTFSDACMIVNNYFKNEIQTPRVKLKMDLIMKTLKSGLPDAASHIHPNTEDLWQRNNSKLLTFSHS